MIRSAGLDEAFPAPSSGAGSPVDRGSRILTVAALCSVLSGAVVLSADQSSPALPVAGAAMLLRAAVHAFVPYPGPGPRSTRILMAVAGSVAGGACIVLPRPNPAVLAAGLSC